MYACTHVCMYENIWWGDLRHMPYVCTHKCRMYACNHAKCRMYVRMHAHIEIEHTEHFFVGGV